MAEKLTLEQLYKLLYQSNISGGVEPDVWFAVIFNTLPHSVIANNINTDILKDLKTIGFKEYRTTRSICSENKIAALKTKRRWIQSVTRGGSYRLIYTDKTLGNFYVILRHHDTEDKEDNEASSLCDASFYHDSSSTETLEFIYSIVKKHEAKKKEGAFSILIKDEYGDLSLRDFKTNVPKDIDLGVNYGKDFKKVHSKIVEKLNKKPAGLYVFHGDPGTGKSTYIKYLSTALPNKKFVYVPEFMMGMLNQPDVIRLFLDNKEIIMVIEDAEKLIKKRDDSEGTVVSTLLNFTDGILSDIMKMPIILTYNTNSDNIDQALLRKGRLQYIHEFGLLSNEAIDKLLAQHNLTKNKIKELKNDGRIKDQMSLADIYNVFEDIGIAVKKDDGKPSFGFGSAYEKADKPSA